MPELPEVETVKNALRRLILNKKIKSVIIRHNNIIANPSVNEFKENIQDEIICDIKRRGKWLVFELSNYYLVSHLRMEGKYFLKEKCEELSKHEHVIFDLGDKELRYHDTRKFGKMYLLKKDELNNSAPLNELGLEPWDDSLDIDYLKKQYKNKKLPIKTVLLDQTIVTGIGNIYADEILFLSKINPYTKPNLLTDQNLIDIIHNTQNILAQAIELGGTTIKSYQSEEGVHGKFQNNLLVHNHEKEQCPVCSTIIIKERINGRGTYYCPNCQKENL